MASPVLPDDLVVVRVGDGTSAPGDGALPVTLDDYAIAFSAGVPTSVTLRQSIALPGASTPPASGNRNLTQRGNASLEGGLALSGDGTMMSLAGYNAAPGALTNFDPITTEDRIVALLHLNSGVVDTSSAFSGWTGATGGTASLRAAYTIDGSGVWAAAGLGVRYGNGSVSNAGTGVALDGTNNPRREVIYHGQLDQSEASNGRSGIETVGSGAPTGSGQTIALLRWR